MLAQPYCPSPFDLPPLELLLHPHSLHRAASFITSDDELRVTRINFASPGVADLAGLGEIVGHVKDFILRAIELVVNREERALANEEHSLRNQALRLENAHRLIGIAREAGYSESDVRRLANWADERQETFVELAQTRRLIGATVITGR
ncbi:MAG TPA: hypothetical protein VN181_05660 [Thermoanaerobaculia bacterium]|nr:hypothetical protein [Thermoanaerobaculia bacterium]